MKVDTYESKDTVSQIGGISSKLTHYPNNLQIQYNLYKKIPRILFIVVEIKILRFVLNHKRSPKAMQEQWERYCTSWFQNELQSNNNQRSMIRDQN